MICGECGKNEAVFYYKANQNGVTTEKRLCARCAEKSGLTVQGFLGQGAFSGLVSGGMLGELLGGMIGNSGGKGVLREAGVCPFCGMRLNELMRSGKAGCAKCYTAFRGALSPTIQKLHGNTEHTGKFPEGRRRHMEQKNKLADLKKRLRDVIEKQEYEQAAALRDEIRALESKGGETSS